MNLASGVELTDHLALSTVRRRVRRDLRPVEVSLLTRHRVELSGHVLEIGTRADGLTDVLHHHAETFTGIGPFTSEIEQCRARYPGAEFLQHDLVDVSEFRDGQFEAVVAGRYAMDQLGDDQRRLLIAGLSRILADTGVLIFSSHNLTCESLVRSPLNQALRRPWKLPSLARALRNRALLGGQQQRSYGYAVLNDGTDHYSQLNYFVSRDTQELQLREHDFRLLECVDRNDTLVPVGSASYRERELYYVARPGAVTWARRLLDGELL